MSFSQKKYDDTHLANQGKYDTRVRKAYLKAIKKTCDLSHRLPLNKNDEFYFRNHALANKEVNNVIKELYTDVYGVTVNGINTEWDLAVEKNNKIVKHVFGKDLDKLPQSYKDRYLSTNAGAKKAFSTRRVEGLNLSDRVWENSKKFKNELEIALEKGLGKGKSADALSRSVRKHLNNPLSTTKTTQKANRLNNPGRGVYRSSYKNARRLTRNETNFSYESSQYEKRNQQDFIVGIEIKTSPRHVLSDDKNGICCSCLQGKYPKNFNWTNKWHVNCRCFSLNIIKSREELNQDFDLILSGKTPNTLSKREVNAVPNNYTNYLSKNKNMWDNWKNKPRTFSLN